VGNLRIYSVPWRDQAAVVADFEKPVDLNAHIREYALTHEKVVELIMNSFTVLPMRLLTIAADRANVLALLKENYDDFKENFARLSQKTEFGLKVLWPAEQIKERLRRVRKINEVDETTSSISPAKMFMKNKFDTYKVEKAFQVEAEKYIDTIDEFFSGIAVEKKLQKLPTEKMLLNASYLVEKSRQNEVNPAFEKLRSAQPGLEYQFSGPWPPYNFIVMEKKKSSDTDTGMSDFLNKILKYQGGEI
jgi:hypothetical protein